MIQRKQWAGNSAALVAYGILSLILFGSTGSWVHRYVAVGVADPELFMWFLNWWPFALLHGLNPFWTHFVWYPQGFDTAWATSVPTLALVAAPLTLCAGATASYNALTLLAPALSAWSCFFLVRSITRDDAAGFVAGLIYGFSSYELGQMLGHLNLDFTALVPLIILLVVKRAHQDISRRVFIPLLAIALVFELGISEEIFASLCILGALVWVVFFLTIPIDARGPHGRLAIEIIGAYVLGAAVASPLFYYLLIGADRVPGAINSPTNFSADPLNFLVPTQVTWLGHEFFPGIASRMLGGVSEQGGYLGIILILILGLYAWEARTNRYARGLIASLLLLVLCSFGPWLHIDGKRTALPLPWIAFAHLPLIKSALPIRFTLYVSLAAAIAVGCWIAMSKGASRAIKLALAIIAYLCLLPNPPLYKWSDLPVDPLFQMSSRSSLVPSGANIIILPFGQSGPDMSWQLDAKMRFTQSGGYVGYPPLNEWAEPIVRAFFAGRPEHNFKHALAAYCHAHQVKDIIIGAGTAPPLVSALRSMRWPMVTKDGDTIITVLGSPNPG